MSNVLIKDFIEVCLKESGHISADSLANYLNSLIDAEIANKSHAGNKDLDPFDRIKAYIPSPYDAAKPEIIMYLVYGVVTMAYNHYKKKYGSIKKQWQKRAIHYKKLLISQAALIEPTSMTTIDAVATTSSVSTSVWG